MRQAFHLALGLLLAASSPNVASADPEPPRGTLAGRIVDGISLAPVEGATVVVTESRGGPIVVSGSTDSDGKFRFGIPPGTYDLLAVFGDARWQHRTVVVEAGKVALVPGAVSVDAEVVTIHEHVPGQKHASAEAVRSTVKPVLPYSDEAIDQNIWAVGWVLLDVDERGDVTAFKFLHHPGHGLDAIAEREVFLLKFDPARDEAGKPMPSKVLWKLEWPAFHYAMDHMLFGPEGQGALISRSQEVATAEHEANNGPPGHLALRGNEGTIPAYAYPGKPTEMRHANGPGEFALPGVHRVPCKGQAPLSLDMHEPIYRDCSPPDLSRINIEPLISRP